MTTTVADAANFNDDETTNGTAGGTPREDPADGTPRKKGRSGEAAVDRTKAVAAIKGGREAKTLEEEADDTSIDDDEVASGGRRRPTMTVADAANVDDNKATNGGRRRPTADVNDNKATSGRRRRPTKAPLASKSGAPPPSHDCRQDD